MEWRDPSTAPQEGWVLALLDIELWGCRVWPVLYRGGRPFQLGMMFIFDSKAKIIKIRDIPEE